jgi:ABC-type dipeptide/oligopeptide/nickel transport system permease component
MYAILQTTHSLFAFAVLAVLALATINALSSYILRKDFTDKDLRISLFALIFSHIQLLLGLVMYFMSPYFEMITSSGMGSVMKDSAIRLYAIEHPLMNILAIALITIGWSKHKKETESAGKFRKIMFFYGLGLLFIASRIPYKAWF